jgi:hypothetical protein
LQLNKSRTLAAVVVMVCGSAQVVMGTLGIGEG